jgi:hypothetical protein
MADKERSSGFAISNAIRAERQSSGMTDRSNLNDTLVKSPQWKKNALQRIETLRSGDSADPATAVLDTLKQSLLETVERHWQELVSNADANKKERLNDQSYKPAADNDATADPEDCLQKELDSLREASAVHEAEARDARRQLQEQSVTLQERKDENERLQQAIVKLEVENARLTVEHQDELDALRAEFLELHDAYEQFRQASDLLLDELDQENACLRAESA